MLVLFLFHFDPVLICCMCLIFVSGAFQAFQTKKKQAEGQLLL